ncbi:MAG TPA: hypothetical protein VHN78_04770, partial [Chloroflexota bacterium]|nr:hypothetical protein [Chloroflexota bacterium]
AVNRPAEAVLTKNEARFEPDLQRAVDEALERLGRDARVLVLPEAANTLPMPQFHTFPELQDVLSEAEEALAPAAG